MTILCGSARRDPIVFVWTTFDAKAAACSCVRRLSRGSNIHSRMTLRRRPFSGLISNSLAFATVRPHRGAYRQGCVTQVNDPIVLRCVEVYHSQSVNDNSLFRVILISGRLFWLVLRVGGTSSSRSVVCVTSLIFALIMLLARHQEETPHADTEDPPRTRAGWG